MNSFQDNNATEPLMFEIIRNGDLQNTTSIGQMHGVLDDIGAVENRGWMDYVNSVVENEFHPQPVMECNRPELKKRKDECYNSLLPRGGSSIKKDRLGPSSSCSVDSNKLKGGKRLNTRATSTSLSSLIDNNIVSLGQKICYLNKRDNSIMKEGFITPEGIKCQCCENVYSVSKFEVHAGSSNHRPAANLFLEDGRSLMQCQKQMKCDNEVKGFEQDLHKQIDNALSQPEMQQMESHLKVKDISTFLKGKMENNWFHPITQQMNGEMNVAGFTRYLHGQMEDGNGVMGFTGNPHELVERDRPHFPIQQIVGGNVQMEGGDEVTGFRGLPELITSDRPHSALQKIVGHEKVCNFTGYLDEEMKSGASCCRENGTCHICCHYGDGLLACSGKCLRMFHLSCVGLEVFPESVWFCPSCVCGLCGKGEYNDDGEQLVEKTILYCDQCECGYHMGCILERGNKELGSCPEEKWFCGEKCKEIFFHLQKLLGKSNPTGKMDLFWTILRFNEDDGRNLNTSSDIEDMTQRKLIDAHVVLRDCFNRIAQPVTKTNLIKDVVFSKKSTIPQLNYRGFYTMILDKGKKPLSVATFRVRGDKVAEVPLVGTRIMARRRGMCRLLIKNLQKILIDMGVQKMIFLASPKRLQSLITTFGFSVATNFDRFKLLEYPYVEFDDTIMCQKLLIAPTT